ncbi:MAG: TIGR03663 family protein [Kiritimatiellaeota bacterium]|nr:TIGR03663 family protein [Kiritimatiellota bacterium]
MKRKTVLRLGMMWGCVAAVCVFAFCFRAARLEARVMHNDEANQAVRAGILLEEGVYHYDPSDHHGPVMYYAAIPFCRATAKTFAETTEWNYRMVPVVFSLMTLVLMMGLYSSDRRNVFTHPMGVLTAIALTALSPAMNYYSRFFIQESMFVTFLTGMLVCAVQYVRGGGGTCRGAWMAGGFGMFLGLAIATKETVVLSVTAAGVAALCVCGYRRLLNAWNTRDFLIMLGVTVLVMVLFFTSFFTHPKGLYDAVFGTVGSYVHRAGVDDHRNPWDFYLKLLFWHRYGPPLAWPKDVGILGAIRRWHETGRVWSEAGVLVLPALLAVVMAFVRRGERGERTLNRSPFALRWVRFIAMYTIALTVLYSAIPYKTPWCVLSFLHGYIVLAGVGVGLVWEWQGRLPWVWRGGTIAGIVLLLVCGGWYQKAQSERACFSLAADIRNPFVYAHTRTDFMDFVAVIVGAAEEAQGLDTPIAVAAPSTDIWPLPWYLRAYTQVGYWTTITESVEAIAAFDPAILIVESSQRDFAYDRFGKGKQVTDYGYGIRPGVRLNVLLPASVPPPEPGI